MTVRREWSQLTPEQKAEAIATARGLLARGYTRWHSIAGMCGLRSGIPLRKAIDPDYLEQQRAADRERMARKRSASAGTFQQDAVRAPRPCRAGQGAWPPRLDAGDRRPARSHQGPAQHAEHGPRHPSPCPVPGGLRMDAMSPVTVSPFGVPFVYGDPKPPRPSMRSICEEVAAKHRVTYQEMCGQRRHREIILARQEAMWRCSHETTASLPMIGRALGSRHHTTILHGVRAHQARLDAAKEEGERA